jgi:hypothetical protein
MVALDNGTDHLSFTLDGELDRSIAPGPDAMTFTTNGHSDLVGTARG